MNQQTLTSEKEKQGCNFESSTIANRCLSVVISFTNDAVPKPTPTDVKFVYSNAEPVDIRLFLDKMGGIHSSFRIIPKSQNTENKTTSISIKEIAPINEISVDKESFIEKESTYTKIEDQVKTNVLTPIDSVPQRHKRGRIKGSKNKPKIFDTHNHKFAREIFETNAEFKARVAEEMCLLNSQTA
jgi:hypothetical protein